MHENRQRLPPSYILTGLVYLGFSIELVGISLSDRSLHPRIVPPPTWLQLGGYLGLAISFVAPILSLPALSTVRSDIGSDASPVKRSLTWLLVILSVFLSLPESLWSSLGHPACDPRS